MSIRNRIKQFAGPLIPAIDAAITAALALKANIADLGTAAYLDTGTTNGKVPLIGAGDKLPSSILPSIAITESLSVANTAARLTLTAAQAAGKAVVEADTGDTYMLVVNGVPATAGDWLKIGDRDVTWSEVSGKPSTFPPSSHTHDSADITDKSTGGNGATDSGKVASFGATGSLEATNFVTAYGINGASSDAVASIVGANGPTGSASVYLGRSSTAGVEIKATNLTGFHTAEMPDKPGTIAMTSDITGTNSGVNTGDETANRIATITHGSTAKTALVDADEIGLADSEASWVGKKTSLTSLWTWITTKLGALTSLTVGGAWNYSSTTRPTSAGTGTPASNSLVMRSDCDTRYGQLQVLKMASNLSAADTNEYYSTENVVLAVGTYEVFVYLVGLTNSGTTGMTCGLTGGGSGTGNFMCQLFVSDTYDDACYFGSQITSPQYCVARNGPNNFAVVFTDAGSRKTLHSSGKGILRVTAEATMSFVMRQRHATDGSNPSVLQADQTYAIFRKIA